MSFDAVIEGLAKEQLREHRAYGMTDYIRGLIVLDKLRSAGGSIMWDGATAFPMWILVAYDLEVEKGEGRMMRIRMKKKP